MSPQESLENFYQSFSDRGLVMKPEYDEIAGPDLIWLDEEYLQSEPKIAIIGKEQRGWDYSYSEFISQWDIKSAISVYRTFDFGKEYYSSPFWRFFHQIRHCAFPQEPNARKKVLWTNLLKFVATDTTRYLTNHTQSPCMTFKKTYA